MHIAGFLHKLLSPVMHLKRLETLKLMVNAALKERKVSITGLGRALENASQEKSNILRSFRFVSNPKLYEERWLIIEEVVRILIGSQQRPWILVDWTKIPNTQEYGLRAALVSSGRALTLYEEVHPKELESNARVHRQFLVRLEELLPLGCCPIIITDAGFHNPWFFKVKELGWDYVGRIRGSQRYRKVREGKVWEKCKDLYRQATTEGKFIGKMELSKSNPLKTYFYMIKEEKKGGVRGKGKNRKGTKQEKEYRRMAQEPWLLASSLKDGYCMVIV